MITKESKLTASEFLDIMFPEHDRTSCSDDDTNNGFYSHDSVNWNGRCRRCIAIQVLLYPEQIPEEFKKAKANDANV